MTRPFRFRPRITPDRLAATLVSLVPIVYFFPAVRGLVVLAPDDGILFNVPLRTAAAQMLRDGFVPLWNPYIFSGMPLHAAVQAGILFPLNWWFLVFSPPTAANLMVLSTYSLAGLGIFLYARRTGSIISGAILTSVVWELSGVLIGQISHINIVQTAALLPWILWSIEGFASTGKRKRGVLVAALVAFQVFAGHPQTLVYSLMLASAYAVVMVLRQPKLRDRYLWSLALIVAGVLLAAVQILPTFELLRNSVRSDASYDFFTSFSLPRRYLKTFFAPYIMGGGDGRLFRAPYIGVPFYGEMIAYVGLLTIMLALLALVLKRDARTTFWAVVVTVGFLLALGDYAPLHLYALIYLIPLLNLFRVPARHLMEVDLALAVLAGRGLTALAGVVITKRERLKILIVCFVVIVITVTVVTIGRPVNFRLGRVAPVSLLRAPELFLPIVFALMSAGSLLLFMRSRRTRASVLVTAVLVLDVFLWGQFSGWTHSPRRTDEVWHSSDTITALQRLAPADRGLYRILTTPHTFDPAVVPIPPSVSHSPDWNLWTQPDVYMMFGVQNAAGYDGFGLQRYSNLAGEMKVWGELTDPDRTLREGSREIDILNVRYVLAMRKQSFVAPPLEATSKDFPEATDEFGQSKFSPTELGLPNLKPGDKLRLNVPQLMADHIALITNLSWSENLPNGAIVGRVRIKSNDGRVFEIPLRAGVDTAEWAHDRPDILSRIRHALPTVAGSYRVEDAKSSYEGHTYVTSLAIPQKTSVSAAEIVVEASPQAPDLLLQVFRVSFVDSSSGRFYPVRREWVRMESDVASKPASVISDGSSGRWHLVTQTPDVEIYENRQALPRAWLASEAHVVNEPAILTTLRTGRLPDGSSWDPQRTALVENEIPGASSQTVSGKVVIDRYEPNRINLTTESDRQAILVLSENHYPGWRAYVDGANKPVIRVDYNLRGILVPAGHHEVRFIYRPKSVFIGLATSLLVILLLAVWLMTEKSAKSRSRLTSVPGEETNPES